MLDQQSFYKKLFLSLLTVPLISCGGGSDSIEEPLAKKPTQITSSSWDSPKLISRNVSVEVTDYLSANKTWTVVINDDNLTLNTHLQVYLDTDSNPATGFQFNGEVWSHNSGADYMIEDDTLYQSSNNDSSWSWKTVQTVAVEKSAQQIKISVPVTSLSGLCQKYNIGVVGLNQNWDIESYYPKSNSMVSRTINYCDTTVTNKRPVITLNDTSPLTILQNSTFVAPQASALDAEDGDISNSITNQHDVNTAKLGTYTITYSVKDSEGLYAIPVKRTIIVKASTSNSGFTVDGLTGDWSSTIAFATNNNKSFKVIDDQTDIYMLVESIAIGDNIQFFIDTDNNSSTGFSFKDGGADFLLENSNLYKFTGVNSNHWSWNLVTTSIPHVNVQNIVELSIPKTVLGTLSNSIKLIFISLDTNWNINYTLDNAFKAYPLQNIGSINRAPDAVEDALETNLNTAIEIDVLANDTDPDGDTLSIASFTQPSLGITTQLNNGKILFNPQGNVGSISFSYTITDGKGEEDTAVVTIATDDPTDTAHSDWPVIVDESITVHSGQTVLIDVLANDHDPDGDTLILDQVDDPAHGVTKKINGKVQFTANVGYTGSDVFWYGVHDGYGHNGAGKVIITIIP